MMDHNQILRGICPRCGEKLRQTHASLSVLRFVCDKCKEVYYID